MVWWREVQTTGEAAAAGTDTGGNESGRWWEASKLTEDEVEADTEENHSTLLIIMVDFTHEYV